MIAPDDPKGCDPNICKPGTDDAMVDDDDTPTLLDAEVVAD